MKILVINWQDWINPLSGGAEVHLHEVFKRVASMGHSVTLFCSKSDDNDKDHEYIEGIEIYRKGGRNTFNFIVPGFYKKNFANKDFDVVVDDINKIPFFTPIFVKKPLLGLSHHFFGKSIFREANFIAGSYVYCAETIFNTVYKNTPFATVSKSTTDEFVERGFDASKFHIVGNAIDHSKFPMGICEKYPEPSVAYFGRLKKYKSVDHLVWAFAKVLEKIPNAKLHLLGRGDFREYLESLCRQLNIEKSVKFWGFVTDEQKADILSKVHCVVNTSMKEGWGITNIEANACGTPVISANSPGLRDSVKNGSSGVLYEYGDIEELSNVVYMLLSEKELNDRLSVGALEWAKSFSWDDSARAMIKACEASITQFKNKGK
jgi:glycosyltransferase involved in cell wall biosynthesis